MANRNESLLIGRLYGNPKVTTGKGGQTMATLIVMVNEYRRNSEGVTIKYTDSFKVRLYGQPASYAATYLWAGSLVMVAGKLRTEKWTDKAGVERYSVVIVIDDPDGLQGLAKPGHKASDEQEEEREGEGEGQPARHETVEGAVASQVAVDAGSAAFEQAHGIQAIPF